MIGRIRGALLAAAVALFGIAAGAPAAKADFIYNLTVQGTGVFTWTGSGSIAFNALSGNSTAGVSAFDFHVSSGAGSPQDYELPDISTVSWAIDSSFNLSFLLTTTLIPYSTNQSGITLTNQGGLYPSPCSDASVLASESCVKFGPGRSTHSLGETVIAQFVAVPEPTTIALFGAGLVGLSVIGRRRKIA